MTEFIERPTIDPEDEFPGLAQLLEDFLTPQLEQHIDPLDSTQAMVMYIQQLKLELPIELQTLRDADNRLTLGTSTPQWIDTTVQPVLHRLRLTLELEEENGDQGNQGVES